MKIIKLKPKDTEMKENSLSIDIKDSKMLQAEYYPRCFKQSSMNCEYFYWGDTNN